MICGGGGQNMKTPIFLASRAFIQNRLDESSNSAHRGMHAKFQLIWTVSLVRARGTVEIDFSSYNWKTSVEDFSSNYFSLNNKL